MIIFQDFMDHVPLTNHKLAKALNCTRMQLWRWKDYVIMEDGSMVHPDMIAKINLTDFKLDEVPTQD